MFSLVLMNAASELLETYRKKGLKIATAESCTGGLVAALLTEIAGSSDVFERGFITYSNEAKRQQLGVAGNLIEDYGAVSDIVAGAMAHGALNHSSADITVAITGIAGPGGATEHKPVGLVYIAVAPRNMDVMVEECHFSGDRTQVRLQAVAKAIAMLDDVSKISFVSFA